ncbi:MAG TPA: hypothetical protein VGB42_10975 [Candidatus Thermoplasmatota archaeon]
MMAFSVQGLQRKVQTIGAAGIIVAAALSLVAVGPVLGGGPPATQVGLYNVTFPISNGTAQGSSGSAGFFSMAEAAVTIDQANLTMVIMHISYVDNSLSPLFNPAVTATIQGPDNSGSATGPVPPGQTADFIIAINNDVPPNTTLQAGSPEEAIDQATPDDTNTTAGMGEWTVTLDVGAPLAGRVRPSGSITYTITVDIQYFEGAAEKA